ncbi:MAG TPA: M23 family metallopeptidase [Streptomyces sp.]|nr:M23 family metallopeptidase [Streptomyces sp.]
MNAQTRPPIQPVRRVARGGLTTALLLGAALGLAGPAAATAQDRGTTAPALTARHPYSPAGGWSRPVSGAWVSCGYGVKGDWAAGHHTGIDLAVPVGTPVHSVGSGKVVFAGYSGSYGYAVTIHMTDGKYTLFAHLSEIDVHVGERVNAGDLVGESGATGNVTGPHLHFEVRAHRRYGSDINPVSYLADHGVDLV